MFQGNSRPFQAGLGRSRGLDRMTILCGVEAVNQLVIWFVIVLMLVFGHWPILLMKMQFFYETICVFSVEECCQFWQRRQILLCWIQGVLLLSVDIDYFICIYYFVWGTKERDLAESFKQDVHIRCWSVSTIRGCVYNYLGSCRSPSSNHHWCNEIRHTYAPIKASYEESRRQDKHIKWFSSIWCYSSVEYNNQWPLLVSHAMYMRAIFSSVIFGWDIRFYLREANTITCFWGDNIERRHISYIKRDHMRRYKSMRLPNLRLNGLGIFQIAAGVQGLPSLTTYWHESTYITAWMSKMGIMDGAWMSNNILRFCVHVITYTCYNINTESINLSISNRYNQCLVI